MFVITIDGLELIGIALGLLFLVIDIIVVWKR